MLRFLLIFFIDIITPVISSTQIACDVMCVQHVIHWLLHSPQKKPIFFHKEFFLEIMASIRNNKGAVSHLDQTWI